MQLTLNTDYAFRVLIYLGLNDEKCHVAQIAEKYHISYNHLTKTVNHLSRLGYIKAQQGRSGGIELAMAASEINLREVLEKCEPSMALVECFQAEKNCIITPACTLSKFIADAREAFLSEMGKHTLADVLKYKAQSLKSILKIP